MADGIVKVELCGKVPLAIVCVLATDIVRVKGEESLIWRHAGRTAVKKLHCEIELWSWLSDKRRIRCDTWNAPYFASSLSENQTSAGGRGICLQSPLWKEEWRALLPRQDRARGHRHMGLSPSHQKLAPKRAHYVETRPIAPAAGRRHRDPNRCLVDLGEVCLVDDM